MASRSRAVSGLEENITGGVGVGDDEGPVFEDAAGVVYDGDGDVHGGIVVSTC